jgi:hypothetical protein
MKIAFSFIHCSAKSVRIITPGILSGHFTQTLECNKNSGMCGILKVLGFTAGTDQDLCI